MENPYIGTIYEDAYSPDEEFIYAVDGWIRQAISRIPHVEDIKQAKEGEYEIIIFGKRIKVEWWPLW